MNSSYENKVIKTKITHLYKHVGVLSFAHPIFGALLCVLFWNKVELMHMYQWFAVFLLIVLARGLNYFRFKRNASNGAVSAKYESYNAIFSGLLGIAYSAAFVYICLTLGTTNWAMVTVLAVMLTAIASIGSASSLKGGVCFSFPVLSSLIVLFVLSMKPAGFALSGMLALYTITLYRTIRPIHESLSDLFEVRIKLEEQVKQSEKLEEKFTNFTVEDTVTRIYNRRFFDLTLNNEIRRAKRMHNDLSLILLDIDCFSEYNEHFGVEAGDKALGAVAGLLKSSVHRGGEYVTRFEDDKFMLILPNVSSEDAEKFAFKLQDVILKANIEHPFTKVEDLDRLSISAGVAEFVHGRPLDRKEIISQALQAVVEAKSQGRNTIVSYPTFFNKHEPKVAGLSLE